MIASVRTAKARLSEFLSLAAAGEEVIVTSDGSPKARIVALAPASLPFKAHWDLLAPRPSSGRPTSEQLVREDRDGRD